MTKLEKKYRDVFWRETYGYFKTTLKNKAILDCRDNIYKFIKENYEPKKKQSA